MRRSSSFHKGLILATGIALSACGGDDPPPEDASSFQADGTAQYGQQPPGSPGQQPSTGAAGGASNQPGTVQPGAQQPGAQQPGAQQPPAGQQPPAAQQQAPALGPIVADPAAIQQAIAGALSGGAAMLGASAGGDVAALESGIKLKAQTDAPGMKPDGELMSARLVGGGHAEGTVTLQPNACYTIIGFGSPGVFDYQINLMTAPPMPPQILAQSPSGGGNPTLGPGDQCVRNPYAVPMVIKVDMHLIRGQGLVGARVYKK